MSFTGASSPSWPRSTSRMNAVAVYDFVIEPIWNSVSGVTSTPVSRLSTPAAAVLTSPLASTASDAPGTRRLRMS
jgi:hypothetical protein